MFALIYYSYLALIDFYMHMYFLNGVRWLIFLEQNLNSRMTYFFLEGESNKEYKYDRTRRVVYWRRVLGTQSQLMVACVVYMPSIQSVSPNIDFVFLLSHLFIPMYFHPHSQFFLDALAQTNIRTSWAVNETRERKEENHLPLGGKSTYRP